MTLEQIAQQAMDYLDSVGVEADYEICGDDILITTDTKTHKFSNFKSSCFSIEYFASHLMCVLLVEYH